jgi:hypothetical protein
LNTTGPYSIVRHPLYLANTLIALGLAMFPHTWVAAPAVILVAAGYYTCIAMREDAFLRTRFGPRFERWADHVPALIPNPGLYVPADRPFDVRAVLRREFYAVALILIAPLVLDVAEDLIAEGVLTFDAVWVATALIGAGIFVVLRTIKKRGRREVRSA